MSKTIKNEFNLPFVAGHKIKGRLGGTTIRDVHNNIVCEVIADEISKKQANNISDLIIRACNNHYDMLELLRDTFDYFMKEVPNDKKPDHLCNRLSAVMTKASK